MTRVGMLTFHGSSNYGAVLQTTALYLTVKSLGFVPEVIDYRRDPLSGRPPHRRALNFMRRRVLSDLLIGHERTKRTAAFRTQNLELSREVWQSSAELRLEPPDYDTYLVGSDQVWNMAHTNSDTSYLFDFVPDGRRRVSYAASFGHDRLPGGYMEVLRKHLPRFDAVSVREASGKVLANELGVANPEHVLDPTLLIRRSEWKRLARPSGIGRGYILAYHMPGDAGITREISHIAQRMARRGGMQVVNVGQNPERRLVRHETNVFGAGPAEFLSLFDGAAGVVTNSFHGTAFAVNMGKPFATVVRAPSEQPTARSGRMISLLSLLGLSEHLVQVGGDSAGPGEVSDRVFETDFRAAHSLLELERERSLDFLRRSL